MAPAQPPESASASTSTACTNSEVSTPAEDSREPPPSKDVFPLAKSAFAPAKGGQVVPPPPSLAQMAPAQPPESASASTSTACSNSEDSLEPPPSKDVFPLAISAFAPAKGGQVVPPPPSLDDNNFLLLAECARIVQDTMALRGVQGAPWADKSIERNGTFDKVEDGVSGWEDEYFPEPDVSDLLRSEVRGGDMPPAVLEGFSQVAGPAHAVAGQGDHGDQQGGDCGAGVGGGGLGVGSLPGGRGAGRGRRRGGAGGHQSGEGAVGRGSRADQDHHGKVYSWEDLQPILRRFKVVHSAPPYSNFKR